MRAKVWGKWRSSSFRSEFGEYLAQMQGGIPMSPGEIVRPSDLGLSYGVFASELAGPLETLVTGNAERRTRLTQLMREQDGNLGDGGLEETLTSIRDEMRKFAESDIVPHAQHWHRTNSYILPNGIAQMAELGVFGLTIPEEYGGLSLGKEAMCVVSEELARGYIGVGSRHALPRLPPSSIISAAPRSRSASGCRRLPAGEVADPWRSSPSPMPGRISPRSRRGRYARAASTRSTATRHGSPIPFAPI